MTRTLGFLIASTLAAGLIGACSSAPDESGQLGRSQTSTPAGSNTGSGSGSGSGTGSTGGTNGDTTGGNTGNTTPPPASTSPTPVQPPPSSGPGSSGSAAHAYFVNTVYSTLANCTACHGTGAQGAPKMMETDATTTYSELDARGLIVTNSLLLTHGTHAGGAAPALNATQQSAVTTWLQMEATERQGTAAPVNVLEKLGGCLDQTLFNNIGLQNLKTTKRTNENANRCTGCDNAPCRVCHTAGDNGFYMALGSNIDNGTFAATKTPQYIVKYFGLNGVEPVASNAIATKSAATVTAAPYTHPMFTLTPAMQTGLDAFVNDAIGKYKAGTCAATTSPADAGTD